MKIGARFARVGERALLEGLQWRASLVYEDTREALLAHPDAISIPVEQLRGRCVRVVEREGKIVGFSAVVPVRPGIFDLDGLFVEPGLWRGGVGRALIEDAARLCRRRGAHLLTVVANPNALRFYEKVGFVVTGEVATRFGRGIGMRFRLVPLVPWTAARTAAGSGAGGIGVAETCARALERAGRVGRRIGPAAGIRGRAR